jgi:DNA-binding CsgD family transcriptional regulator
MAQRPGQDASDSGGYDADSALLIVDSMGRVQSGSGHAWTLLNRALGRALTLGTLQDFAHTWAQPFLVRLVQCMQVPQRNAQDQLPLAVQRNRYGMFYLRGYVLEAGRGAPALYGIQIQRRATLEQLLFGSARFRGLTASEREVALRLARGATPGDIAQDLGVKTSTAIFHTRNIYRRLEINQRAQLVPALMA